MVISLLPADSSKYSEYTEEREERFGYLMEALSLEHSARCPGSSKVVEIALEFALFGDASSNVVQERPTGL
jgi:hypothetical protein